MISACSYNNMGGEASRPEVLIYAMVYFFAEADVQAQPRISHAKNFGG
jgi:hypothetical protein